MKLQQEEQRQKPNKSTKKYDEVSNKIRKLLSATAQTFVPELAEALKQDWFPTMPHKELQRQKQLRDYIRDKIFDDWSSDSIYSHSKDNIWNDATIQIFLPDWLKNPALQTDSQKEILRRANEAKSAKKVALSKHEKEKIQQIAETLPDRVIPPEDEEPKKQWLTDEVMQELGVAEYGETGKSTRDLTGDISLHAYKLFAALTNNKSPPNESDDLLVDYIRPSREFRRGLMLEVDHRRRVNIHNVLHYVSVALEDMIEIIKEIEEKSQ